jgi:hypothetical protein
MITHQPFTETHSPNVHRESRTTTNREPATADGTNHHRTRRRNQPTTLKHLSEIRGSTYDTNRTTDGAKHGDDDDISPTTVISSPPLAGHGHEAQCLGLLRDAAKSRLRRDFVFYGLWVIVNNDKQEEKKKKGNNVED